MLHLQAAFAEGGTQDQPALPRLRKLSIEN